MVAGVVDLMDANRDELAVGSDAYFANDGDTKFEPGAAFEASGNLGLVNAPANVNNVGRIHK